jgi:predicted DNA-binding transcriptional regulator AlpA
MQAHSRTRKRRKPSRLWHRTEYDSRSVTVSAKHLPLTAGIHYLTAWRMRQRDPNSFPAPIALSPGRIAWRRSDLEKWLAERGAIVSPIVEATLFDIIDEPWEEAIRNA